MAAGAAWVERISFIGRTSLFYQRLGKPLICYCISAPGKGQPGKRLTIPHIHQAGPGSPPPHCRNHQNDWTVLVNAPKMGGPGAPAIDKWEKGWYYQIIKGLETLPGTMPVTF